ncbi:MAG: hypothetical protein SOW55_04300 [Bacilli bacterium]|nr:hypothetical protein [Bacilli bacterium]
MKKQVLFLSIVTLLTICSCSIKKPSISESNSSLEENTSSSSLSSADESLGNTSNESSSVSSSLSDDSLNSSNNTSSSKSSETTSSSSSEVTSSESSVDYTSSSNMVSSSITSSEDSSSDISSVDSSSDSSSSSESSEITVSTEEITFNTSSESSEITSSILNLPNTMSYDSSSKVFGGDNAIKFGASKANGSLKINISSCNILSISLVGKTYSTDTDVGIKVSLSNGETKNVVVNSSFSEELVFDETSSSSSFTISSTASKKRFYLEKIVLKVIYGENNNSGSSEYEKKSIKYTSPISLTNGNVPSSKVNSEGYYQPTVNSELNIDNYSYYYSDVYFPSTGKNKLLVVPVDFTDYKAESKLGGEDNSQKEIYNCFFGDSKDTGWESVRSYYEKSSYGSLIIEGEVTPWYHSSYSTKAFCQKVYSGSNHEYSSYYDPTWDMLDEVTSWAKNTLKIDLSEYDSNNDGLIDGVWMVYSCPYEYLDENVDENGVYWAYTYGNYDNLNSSTNNIKGFKYSWASYSFMNDGGYGKVDAHTYIHETGHMLGLDDYYNYDNPTTEGVCGGVDMMDYNIGDHGAYSKYLLNWTTPYVIDGTKESVTINLKPFESSGDFILLSSNFNDSPFDEYITIEYYTPTGLNQKDTTGYCDGLNTYTDSGIKINHIDSRILQDPYDKYGNYLSSQYVDSFVDSSYYEYYIGANNTPSYSVDTENDENSPYRLIQLIEATNKMTFKDNDEYSMNYGTNEVLFNSGDSFSMNQYNKFFTNGSKLNSGDSLPYEVIVGEINQDGSISITINKI